MVLEPRTRILRILQVLQAETDEKHSITIVEIISLTRCVSDKRLGE